MPIHEYYSPDTHKIYSFFARTLAQGQRIPLCPDNPRARMEKLLSTFAVVGSKQEEPSAAGGAARELPGGRDEERLEAAMSSMESEFSGVDENDPRAMARMMRRMAELSGEKLDEPMEEAVRKLEEGADPDSIEEQMGDAFGPEGEGGRDAAMPALPADSSTKGNRAKCKVRRPPARRDPK